MQKVYDVIPSHVDEGNPLESRTRPQKTGPRQSQDDFEGNEKDSQKYQIYHPSDPSDQSFSPICQHDPSHDFNLCSTLLAVNRSLR